MTRRYVDLSMTLCNDVINDPPFLVPHIEYETHGDTRHELASFFPGAGVDIGYCHIEKMHNPEELPGNGFTTSCFLHKIKSASAGWTRAVAIFDN